MTKVAHNMTVSMLAYQVIDSKAMIVIDDYYPYALNEMVLAARYGAIKNGLIVPLGLSQYNEKMGCCSCRQFKE